VSSSQRALTVTRAQALWSVGLQALEQRKQEINDLNVYPVPDGDTGTNMALTVKSIVEGVSRLPATSSQAEVCSAVSQSALMGARGNSGVILSQMIRGAMEVLSQAELSSVQTFITAFRHATDTAYRAVRRPVEGTMLTVLRDMAEAAAKTEAALDPDTFLRQVVAAGWESVARTPKLLKVLAEAGVVDAGGFGLVVLLEGIVDGRAGAETPIALRWAPQPEVETGVYAEEAEYEEESRFTYCTSFLLSGSGLVPKVLEEKLSSLGDSLLVVGDQERVKVHLHTDHPGEVLTLATSLGVLTEIEIDNMREQQAAREARLAAQGSNGQETGQIVPQVPPPSGALSEVVAVVAGEGNKALFRNLGIDLIVDGGQSMNPSTEDLLRAIQKVKAPAVILLPNNGNVIMTAEQTVGLAGCEIHVVPTRSIQAGLSAAVAFDRRRSAEANAKDMWAAAQAVTTGEVTRAVRDSSVDGIQVRAGQYMGLVDEQVVAASDDLEEVVELVVARLLAGGQEMLTALLGEGQEAAQVRQALESLRDRYPGVEIELHSGGQPFYPVLLFAE
jgi:DAK2 domain fusion protein YloV